MRPEAIVEFVRKTGISRNEAQIEMDLFEEVVRDDLNPIAPRVLGVVDPLKVVLTNYEGEEDRGPLLAPGHPQGGDEAPSLLPGALH